MSSSRKRSRKRCTQALCRKSSIAKEQWQLFSETSPSGSASCCQPVLCSLFKHEPEQMYLIFPLTRTVNGYAHSPRLYSKHRDKSGSSSSSNSRGSLLPRRSDWPWRLTDTSMDASSNIKCLILTAWKQREGRIAIDVSPKQPPVLRGEGKKR